MFNLAGIENVIGIDKIEIKTVKVTHHTAEVWLQKNLVNRRLDGKRVNKYARDMQEGRWKTSPQDMICFDTEGKLMNGQHRLSAVLRSKVPIVFFIATECPPELQIVMDKGRPRRVSDNLHMFHDVPKEYAAKVASIARYINTFSLGIWETPNEQDAIEVWQTYKDGFIWLFKEAEETPWNKGAYYASPLLYTFAYDPGLARSFHSALATCRPQADLTAAAALYRTLQSPRLRTGGANGFKMSLRVFNALLGHVEGRNKMRSLHPSTVGYDKLKRRWGLSSKRQDDSCGWTNCPGTVVDQKSRLCWIHKNHGNRNLKN